MGRRSHGLVVAALGACVLTATPAVLGTAPAGAPRAEASTVGVPGHRLERDPVSPRLAARVAAHRTAVPAAAYPLSQTFELHSLPGSQHTIYLDFDGADVTGTAWNGPDIGLTSGFYRGWSTDADAGFSTAEQSEIQNVWQRVAEDYAPFDVDVTTADPGPDALDRTGLDDPTYGTQVLVTSSNAAMRAVCTSVCSGSAWFDIVDLPANHAFYQPSLVFPRMLGDDAKNVAEVISHEVGHNFGLLHDGTTEDEYYSGHRSWAPIMGASFSRPITQWSRGDYAAANNQQDDLALIAANGAPLRADEAPATVVGAGALPRGPAYITSASDRDVYALGTCSGPLALRARPARVSPDLDLRLTLLRADGTVVARANKPSRRVSRDVARGLAATLDPTVPPGTYFLAVKGAGHGGVLRGYDNYASVGSYTLWQRGCVPDGG